MEPTPQNDPEVIRQNKMREPQKQEWEERFKEEMISIGEELGELGENTQKRLKSLTYSLLLSQKENLLEKIEGVRKEMEEHECPEVLCPHYPRTDAWNRCLDKAKEIISNEE